MDGALASLFRQRSLSVLRVGSADLAAHILDVCIEAGLQTNEVPLTTPGALALVKAKKAHCGAATNLGVGTVLTVEQCRAARDHGADFAVTPNLNLAVVRECIKIGLPIIPGCYTPSEMQLAHEEGAAAVKLFPASSVGPGFIKAVLAPLPHLRIIAMGGVNLENAQSYLAAGAAAVGVGTQVFGDIAQMDNTARERTAQAVRRLLSL